MADSLKTLVIDNADGPRGDVLDFLYAHKPGRSSLAAEKWAWRYVDSPAGKGIITVMVDAAVGERIVGHNALALVPGACDCEPFTAAMSGGTLVDEAYRSRGVFIRIRTAEDEVVRTRSLPVLTTLPNRLAVPGYLLTRYRHHQQFEIAVKALSLIRPEAVLRPASFARQAALRLVGSALRLATTRESVDGLRVEPLAQFGEETDALWRQVGRKGYLGICKDAAYLRWRYGRRPDTATAACLGWVNDEPRVLCAIEWQTEAPRTGWVAELIAGPGDEALALATLAQAERRAANRGIRYLTALADGVGVTGDVLNRLGYVRREVRPFMIRIFQDHLAPQLARPWRYSMGDFLTGS